MEKKPKSENKKKFIERLNEMINIIEESEIKEYHYEKLLDEYMFFEEKAKDLLPTFKNMTEKPLVKNKKEKKSINSKKRKNTKRNLIHLIKK